ncbi:MAG: hypothetical protein LBR20_06435 [Propionibacteriaceae bacterium]|jgi:hypothetical protein|nr:hypothetical protein [Propionibacteriaceae bacterium]
MADYEEWLAWPFPMPETPELCLAFSDLALFERNPDTRTLIGRAQAERKKRIGDPAGLPKPYDPPSCTSPALRAELYAWLEKVVDWYNHEYVWDPDYGLIPPCWPHHPHLVHDIALLADQRRRAQLDPNSNNLEAWVRYSLNGFISRMAERVKRHCREHHQKWPAAASYNVHMDLRAERAELFQRDVQTLTPLIAVLPIEGSYTISVPAGGVDRQTGEIVRHAENMSSVNGDMMVVEAGAASPAAIEQELDVQMVYPDEDVYFELPEGPLGKPRFVDAADIEDLPQETTDDEPE